MKEKIVFFDGVCNLCNSSVDTIVKHDSKGQLKIASLQGETARKLLDSTQIEKLDSLIFYNEGDLFEKSTGALKISSYLNFPLNLMRIFLVVPSFLRDPVYNLIARNRYKLFGQTNSCRLPTEAEKRHFLP